MPLRDIRGHRRLLELLAGAVGRKALPPTLLFDGPEGVGKYTTAMALAQALNCLQPIEFAGGRDGCGTCASCRKIARGTHPDIATIAPDDGSIKVDTIRDEVLQKSGFRPFEGRMRVFVVDQADSMVPQAQDALLKTLEEPPPGSVFILVSAVADSLLPTVRSRSYRLRFGRLSEVDVTQVLQQKHHFDEVQARAASAIADGSVGRALAAEQGELVEAREFAARLLQSVATGRAAQRLEAGKAFVAGPRNGAVDRSTMGDRLLAVSSILRDLGILASRAEDSLLANADLKAQLGRLLPAFAADRVVRAFSSVDQAVSALERNASPKIVADWVSLEI
ncbi:MAG: ATP-binding protein [Acidobacteriota bacterium]